jgi:hypothetical protein
VSPSASSYDAIWKAVTTTSPNEGPPGSPVGAAVSAASQQLARRTTGSPKFIVLASDGQPSCPDNEQGMKQAIEAVQAAARVGVSTFVLGIAAPGSRDDMVLNQLALAGEHARPGAEKYFTVSSKNDLVGALGQIATRVTKCVFGFDQVPPSPEHVAVYVDGARVPSADWRYAGDHLSIEISGGACQALRAGTATRIEMILGCPGVPVP